MKKTMIAAALAVLSAGAIACQSCPTPGTGHAGATVHGSNLVASGSAAQATSSGNGSSFSFGSNRTIAATSVNATADVGADRTLKRGVCTTTLTGSVGISGTALTSSESVAYNISSGNASGGAAAGGIALAQVGGAGAFHVGNKAGFVAGGVQGEASSHTANGVLAGTNQGGYVFSGNASGFSATADGKLTQTADGRHVRGCITCNTPYTDVKNVGTTTTAFSESVKIKENGIDGLGNAQIGNKNGGTSNVVAVAGGFAVVSDTAADRVGKPSKRDDR